MAPKKAAAKPATKAAAVQKKDKAAAKAKAKAKEDKPAAKAKGKAAAKAAAKEAAAAAAAAERLKQRKPRSREGAEEAKAAAKMTAEEWKELQVGMVEKWPQPAYMATPGKGGHTCYRDDTYEIITRWTAETKIEYRPHAKAPGSKSHVRYEEYSQATTVAQALEIGSWPADWCWDFERGFIKVLGPVRDEPMDPSKVTEETTMTDVDKAICRWYLRELAKKYGLRVEDLKAGKGGSETLMMRAHRLVAQREAKKALEAAKQEGRKITDQEVLTTLQNWAFAKNPNRTNVVPEGKEWVWSDTLGVLRDRLGDIHVTGPSKQYPEVVQIINQYLLDRLPKDMATFKWTSLNLNCNYAARLHRDGNNFGPSFIKAFGEFTGGELNYWPEDDRKVDNLEALKDEDKVQLDLKNGLALFNGNSGHSVENFEGDRFSIVYFTIGCYDKAPKECKDECKALGMQYPAPDEDPRALLRAPKGYSSGKGGAVQETTPNKKGASTSAASSASAGKPCWRFFPSQMEKKGAGGPGRAKPSAAATASPAQAQATPEKQQKRKAPQVKASTSKKRGGGGGGGGVGAAGDSTPVAAAA